MMTRKAYGTYYSDDKSRAAHIFGDDICFYVDFYFNNVIITSMKISDHSLRYVEDIAENYVDGILEVKSLEV